jgi:hypothetical protein
MLRKEQKSKCARLKNSIIKLEKRQQGVASDEQYNEFEVRINKALREITSMLREGKYVAQKRQHGGQVRSAACNTQ